MPFYAHTSKLPDGIIAPQSEFAKGFGMWHKTHMNATLSLRMDAAAAVLAERDSLAERALPR